MGIDFFIETIGVGIAISLVFAVVLGFISFMRYLRYKETIELAKQGLLSPRHANRRGSGSNSRSNKRMRSGVITAAVGLALTLGLSTIGFEENNFFGPWLLGGLIPLAVGLGMYFAGKMSLYDDGPYQDSNHIPRDFDDDHIDPIPPHKRDDRIYDDIHFK